MLGVLGRKLEFGNQPLCVCIGVSSLVVSWIHNLGHNTAMSSPTLAEPLSPPTQGETQSPPRPQQLGTSRYTGTAGMGYSRHPWTPRGRKDVSAGHTPIVAPGLPAQHGSS